MEPLLSLVTRLSDRYINYIERFYLAAQVEDSEGLKSLELLRLIRSGEVKTDLQAAKVLYGKKPNSAYSHLKRRLEDDIFSIILTLRMRDARKVSSSSSKELLYLVESLKGLTMRTLGLNELGNEHLKRTKLKSISDQMPLPAVITAFGLSTRPFKTSKELETNLDQIEANTKALFNIATINGRLMQVETYRDGVYISQKHIQELEELKTLCNEILNETGFQYLKKDLLYLQATLFVCNHEFEKALTVYEELQEFVVENKKIFQTGMIKSVLLMKYELLLILNQQSNLEKEWSDASEIFTTTARSSYLEATLILVMGFINHRKMEQISPFVKDALNPRKPNRDREKWLMAHAAYLFLKDDYDSAIAEMDKCEEMKKDKTKGLLKIRILEIMCFIEQGLLDLIEFRVEALRKILYRHKDGPIMRAKLIVEILYKFVRTGYNYKETFSSTKQKIDTLKEGKGIYIWHPLSSEIIRFDQWFESKAKQLRDA